MSAPIAFGTAAQVVGSTGRLYTVVTLNGVARCSCKGFEFRGHCRHVRELQSRPAACPNGDHASVDLATGCCVRCCCAVEVAS